MNAMKHSTFISNRSCDQLICGGEGKDDKSICDKFTKTIQ